MSVTCNLRPMGNRVYLQEFITPRTYLIDQIAPTLQGLTREETTWNCWDWVCRNIKYKGERGDVWHTPSEAIYAKESDCEEKSFTLCSLLRASGMDSNEVFVAVGKYGNFGHAWVVWYDGRYYVLEATLERAPTETPEQAYPYDPWILFNDCDVRELKSGFMPSRANAKKKIRQIQEFYGIKR